MSSPLKQPLIDSQYRISGNEIEKPLADHYVINAWLIFLDPHHEDQYWRNFFEHKLNLVLLLYTLDIGRAFVAFVLLFQSTLSADMPFALITQTFGYDTNKAFFIHRSFHLIMMTFLMYVNVKLVYGVRIIPLSVFRHMLSFGMFLSVTSFITMGYHSTLTLPNGVVEPLDVTVSLQLWSIFSLVWLGLVGIRFIQVAWSVALYAALNCYLCIGRSLRRQ